MFQAYRLENLDTDEMLLLDSRQYLWASLGGPLYVLARGFPRAAFLSLALSVAIVMLAVAVMVIAVGFLDNLLVSILASAIVPLAALGAQGVIAVELVRGEFLKRGWREGY